MKKYVIDASVAVKWYSQYDEDDLIQADNLLRIYAEGVCEFMAPTLIAYELGNALRFNPNFGLEEAVEAMQNFFALQIVLEDPYDYMNAAVDLAYTYTLTVYDAVYVALSQITATPLITADYKFYARAKELTFIEPLKDLKL